MLFYNSRPIAINQKEINNLKTLSGTAIFVDIVGSTALKVANPQRWIILIGNTLNYISQINVIFRDHLVKIIGDELMIFIPDKVLKNENFFTIIDLLKTSMEELPDNKDLKLATKAAINYCECVFPISFIQQKLDYYGKEIDLTARLLTKAEPNQIIISEKFYTKLNDLELDNFQNIENVCQESFKGFATPIKYRRILLEC